MSYDICWRRLESSYERREVVPRASAIWVLHDGVLRVAQTSDRQHVHAVFGFISACQPHATGTAYIPETRREEASPPVPTSPRLLVVSDKGRNRLSKEIQRPTLRRARLEVVDFELSSCDLQQSTMQIYSDNPAGRLEQVLRDIKSHGSDATTQEVLSLVLGAQVPSELMRSLGRLLELPAAAEEAVRRHVTAINQTEDLDFYLLWVPSVQRAMRHSLSLTSTVAQFQNSYSDADLLNLATCDKMLHHARVEPRIEQASLDNLRSLLAAIEDEIERGELDETLQRFLYEQVDEIKLALREYRLRGAAAFNDAFDSIFGGTVRATTSGSIDTNDPATKPWMQHIKALLATLQMMVAVAQGYAELPSKAGAVVEALLPGD